MITTGPPGSTDDNGGGGEEEEKEEENCYTVGYYTCMPVAVYDGCGIVAFFYWLRVKQYL